MFQQIRQRYDQVHRHLTTTDWVRVAGHGTAVAIGLSLGFFLYYHLGADELFTGEGWRLADLGDHGMTPLNTAVLSSFGAAIVAPVATTLLYATTRTRATDPVRRSLVLLILPLAVVDTVIVGTILTGQADLSPYRTYLDVVQRLAEFNLEVLSLTVFPTLGAVFGWTVSHSGVDIDQWSWRIAGVVLLLLFAGPALAAPMVAPDRPPRGEAFAHSSPDVNALGYEPAQQSALACENETVRTSPGSEESTAVAFPTEYDPASVYNGTDHLWVSAVNLTYQNGTTMRSDEWYGIHLRPDGAEPVDRGHVVTTGYYNVERSGPQQITLPEFDTVHGFARFPTTIERLTIAVDVITDDGRIRRYVYPLCPPAPEGTA